MKRLDWRWPAVILISTAEVFFLSVFDIQSPMRAWGALWFLFVIPGMAFIRLFSISDKIIQLTLAVALSFALDGIVAGGMLYAGVWSPNIGLTVLGLLSVFGAALQLRTEYQKIYKSRMEDLVGREGM